MTYKWKPSLSKIAGVMMFSVLTISVPTARAGDNGTKSDKHPRGYVDGSEFADLANPDADLVEVMLGKPMLKTLGNMYAKNVPEMAALLRGFDSIQAVVASLDEKGCRKAQEAIDHMTRQLERDGWERLARVRDGEKQITVFVLANEEEIDGLTVLILEKDAGAGQVIFTNIAGRLQLDMMPLVGSNLQIPGLSIVPKAVEQENADQKEAKTDEEGAAADSKPDEGNANEAEDTESATGKEI